MNFVLDWDTEDNLRFCALQSETGRALLRRCGKNADDISSIVLVDANGARFQSEAILVREIWRSCSCKKHPWR